MPPMPSSPTSPSSRPATNASSPSKSAAPPSPPLPPPPLPPPAPPPPAPPLDAAAPHVLYVVSTPIGNARDLTPRAASILASVDVVAAEDTRRAGLLLARLRPRAAPRRLLSCHAHNWRARAPRILDRLRAGASVAVVCDAGTPAVSDPGAELAAAAVRAGLRVVPVPGACAALAAVAAAALPAGVDFVVAGFLPRAGKDRRVALARLGREYRAAAVVLYEAPHRVVETLEDLVRAAAAAAEEGRGARTVCLAREVTKRYEEIQHFGSARDALAQFVAGDEGGAEARVPRGEYTIVVGPEEEAPVAAGAGAAGADEVGAERLMEAAEVDVRALVAGLVRAGTPLSVLAKAVAAASGVSRKVVYAYASQVKEEMRAEEGEVDAEVSAARGGRRKKKAARAAEAAP